MDKAFSEVFPNIRARQEIAGLFGLITVKKLRYSPDRTRLFIYADVLRLVPKETIREIESLIDRQVLNQLDLHAEFIEHYRLSDAYNVPEILEVYRESLIDEIAEELPVNRRFLNKGEWKGEPDGHITICLEEHPITKTNAAHWSESIRAVFNERFDTEVSVEFSYLKPDKDHVFQTAKEDIVRMEKIPEETSEPAKETAVRKKPLKEVKNTAEAPKNAESGRKAASQAESGSLNRGKNTEGQVRAPKRMYVSNDPNQIYGRNFDDEIRPISSYDPSEEGTMVIAGEIMAQEVRELRNGERSILSFTITDYTDSINVKLFVANEDVKELSGKLAPGTVVRLKGMAQFDSFDKELTIRTIQGIVKHEAVFKKSREDHATVKRVELHCHTKASENDGIAEAADLLKTAAGWGHPAMAITDHGCVYGFTDAFHALSKLKKPDFKVIYGMEGYLVDDTKESVVLPGALSLDSPAVVFDIETTGLSPVHNAIIEIGAVKVENGRVVDRFSSFVNPRVPIPYRIESLTGISDEMVKDAPDIDTVLPAFLSFCEGCYLVAHNAEFDVTFIKENMKHTVPEKSRDLSYADTMGIARILLSHLKNYRLDTLAKELNVTLENHHRAVDDAECTAWIYLKMIERLKNRGLSTLEDVRRFTVPDAEAIRKMKSYHVVLLASDTEGLINLYHLVSESGLEYFGGRVPRPRIPKSRLTALREGIIVGSACVAGEVFNAVMEGAADEEMARLVGFYDYLEIQPLGNNRFLLGEKDNDFNTEEDLRDLNRRITALGEQYHKPVCATGDVHFLNPDDGLYRKILQVGCGYKESEDDPPLYLRTTEEMLEEFDYLGADKAYEVVVTNTNLIADRIEKIEPVRPDKCPPVIENADEDLRNICYTKMHEWYGDNPPEIVVKRLDRELNSIISNGYAVMYIIAQKLVHKSVSDGYLVGSRGSVGSSFAATMAGITEVNPLVPHYRCPKCRYSDFDSEDVVKYQAVTGCDMPDKACPVCGTNMIKDGYNIPFETFLGFKGNKEPDIDLNFSGEYQSKAHAYTEVIFGKGQTFKAGTVGTVAEKTAIGYTMHYMEDMQIRKRFCEITRIAHHLEGVRRTSGQHPGGIIVLPIGEDINTFTPTQHPANDQTTTIVTTHFDYHSIDHNLLKLDILGHDDPTMIRMLQDLTGVDPRTFPLDTKEVMSLFQNTSALGVTPEEIRGCPLGAMGLPEFGTDNAINMLMETKPNSVSDLIRISGLSHGTNVWHGNAQTLIAEGKCTIASAVCTRDDIMVYLISMGIENETAFNIMEKVRKGVVAKGKCDNWPEWKQLMLDHNVPDWYIWSCEKIEYMFPKAHAAAYVMMALRIAYCKVFYPLAYYCAYFSIRANGFNYELMCLGKEILEKHMDEYEAQKDKLSAKDQDVYRDMKIVQEMYARGYSFVPIDIFKASSTRFQIVDDRHLMPSLTSIDGMGDTAADTVVEAAKGGTFTSLADFRSRTKVSQTIIDKMVELHILDNLPKDDQFSLFDL